jgi:ubiquitin C-terminal hydrolase
MIIQSVFGLLGGSKQIAEFHMLLTTAEPFFDCLGTQQDAHEALLYVLDVLHLRTKHDQNEELGLSQPLSQSSQMVTSAVKSTFYGSYKVSSKCLVCKIPSILVEPFQEIPVDYNNVLCRALKNSLVEVVPKLCQSCSSNTPHCINKTIWQQPKVTIIRINRFKQMSTGRMSKNHNKVCVSELLTFENFKGKLIGMISHQGTSLSSGHYVSYVSGESTWYKCSDEKIDRVSFTEFCDTGESYILFYQEEI